MESQTTSDVLMIRPAAFASNPQTAASNRFQTKPSVDADSAEALKEFDGAVSALSNAGIRVHVFQDSLEPHTPDSLFPNNWFSTHADGTIVIYPMLAPNRRLERRMDVFENLSRAEGFHVREIIDLTAHESRNRFLEGTGSLVLDRPHRIAYACLSPRTDIDLLGEFAQRLDYDLVAFDACDAERAPVYHTNVVMAVGTGWAAVCLDAIAPHEQKSILDQLDATERQVISLTLEQMHSFAGNMLELQANDGDAVIALSNTALRALTVGQRKTLEAHASLLPVDIPTIERVGGGSIRCMLAEIFLPKKAAR
jgi:hypothetical protein